MVAQLIIAKNDIIATEGERSKSLSLSCPSSLAGWVSLLRSSDLSEEFRRISLIPPLFSFACFFFLFLFLHSNLFLLLHLLLINFSFFFSLFSLCSSSVLLFLFLFHRFLLLFLFSPVPRASTPRFVGPLVRPSITVYFFWFFAVFGLTAPAQMMK